MVSIVDRLVKYVPGETLRTSIQRAGFDEFYRGNTYDWDIKFDDSMFRPDNVVIVAYDKDLDCDFDGWFYGYQQKDVSDSVSVYQRPISDISRVLVGLKSKKIKTSTGEVAVPYIQDSREDEPEFLVLPFEKKKVPGLLISGGSRDVTFPSELISILYLTDSNMAEVMVGFLSVFPVFGSMPRPLDFIKNIIKNQRSSTCSGLINMYLVLYTGPGNGGLDYVINAKELVASICAHQKFVDDNDGDSALQGRVDHAQEFLKKFYTTAAPFMPKNP